MDINSKLVQIGRFIWIVILLQIVVYIATGMICWYRSSLNLYQLSISLSWAGFLVFIISGVLFMAAKPKRVKPSQMAGIGDAGKKDQSKMPLEQMPGISNTLFSTIKPLMKRSALTGDIDTVDPLSSENEEKSEEQKSADKISRMQLYYYSGMAAVIGAITIATSEIIYRVVLTAAK